jgi:flagellar protein FlaG
MNPIIAATAKPSTISGNDGKTLPPVAGTRSNAEQAQPAQRPAQQQATEASIHQVEAYLKAHDQSVRFQLDQQTGMTIVHVYNKATGEVVRQIPTEEIVRIAQFLQQDRTARVDVKA